MSNGINVQVFAYSSGLFYENTRDLRLKNIFHRKNGMFADVNGSVVVLITVTIKITPHFDVGSDDLVSPDSVSIRQFSVFNSA